MKVPEQICTSRGLTLCFAMALGLVSGAAAAKSPIDFSKEPACNSLLPVSQGGPAPRSPNLVVIRYLGAANEEVAYRGNIFLIDAWYRRVPPARPLGFDRSAVKMATAILVDHAHGDHFADVPFVARQTGAPVIGAPISIETALKLGIPAAQTKVVTGKGGELLQYPGVSIEPVLALHHVEGPNFRATRDAGAKAYTDLIAAAGLTRTPEQQAEFRTVMTDGSADQRVITEGTIGFLFTFANGYRIYYRDAAGTMTDYEKALASRIGSPDVGMFAYSDPEPDTAVAVTMQPIRLFKPGLIMPIHHDDVGGTRFETPTEPLFLAIRNELPKSRGLSPLYRTPVCLDTESKQVFIGP